jgi:hypothetical protein
MLQKTKTVAIATVVLMTSTLVITMPAQQPGEVESPDANSHILYDGGFVRAKRAVTSTLATTFSESVFPTTWKTLPLASRSYTVPAGATYLFNVSFSAECRLFGGGGDDWVRIRIVDTVGGVSTPLQPDDGGVVFCSADGYAMHKGNWVKNAGAGTHTLQVQFWIFDGAPAEALSARIDDWTLELVVYD